MILGKKQNKLMYFWVQNYTEQEKEFFLKLGFTERGDYLNYHGSCTFGFWSHEEFKRIKKDTMIHFKMDKLKIRTFTPMELV